MAKQISAPVPGIAPVTAIGDPATRRVIQDLVDSHTTRNGRTQERFLTEADVKDLAFQIVTLGLSNYAAAIEEGSAGGLPGWGSVGAVVEALEQMVRNDPLFIKLGERIEFLTQQNSLALAKIAAVGDGFVSERIERISGDAALLEENTSMKVTVGQNVAAILDEKTVRATQDSVLASAINTIFGGVGNSNALIQQGGQLAVNWNAAQAARWNQLQTQVFTGDGRTIRQALQEEVSVRADRDGKLSAHYTMKIDQNGWVSGFGLMSLTEPNSAATSAFYVRADRFAIGSPAAPAPDGTAPPEASIPFIVQTTATTDPGTGAAIPPGVYMRDAFIKNASVDTLKIAGHAVTIPLGAVGQYAAAVSFTISAEEVGPNGTVAVFMLGTAVLGSGVPDTDAGRTIQIELNGVLQSQERPARFTTGTLMAVYPALRPGAHTVTMRQPAQAGDVRTGLFVSVIKR